MIAVLSLFVWPWQNERSAILKDQFERRSDLSRVAPGQFQTSADGERTFFFEGDASDPATGRNVFIVASHGRRRVGDLGAQSGAIQNEGDGRFLVLSKGQRNEQNARSGEKTLSRFETYRAQAGERVLDAAGASLPPRRLPTADAAARPDAAATRASSSGASACVLAAANMLLLGIGMSASNPRHASNWNLLFALLGFVVYYNLINLSQAWVARGPGQHGRRARASATAAPSCWRWRCSGGARTACAGSPSRRRRRRRRAPRAHAA